MTVDFILALQYDEVNVNNDPRIFSNYGHIVRKSSMDGAMDMKTYYMLTEEDNSSAESGHSLPLSMDEVKNKEAKDEELKQEVEHHIGAARELLDFSPGIQVLKTEVNTAETFLRDGVFYEPVPPEESKAVIMSMEKEFLGTGRWYRRVQRPSRHGR
ncbi:hypothetical protein BKA67DRAFT_664794 [Truncatella angustata]|uniref:Uncharacterized protein n=1 Tax=Truncatella angustata TaxID=152316 RepID=A0A9P8RKH6_9PEZI|nr:uncharacterized protein BKA67DRAFT_664794 [Truncatella angustata]KAH6644940.1 hypothetical protein BKA67DRAFT_664794 [Truncatella angustata]